MATLRDLIGVTTANPVADQIEDQYLANGMGSLRRGFEAGRIGNELNPLRTEELDARIAGDEDKRLQLRGEIDRLSQRQQMYAPEVGRVEQVNGVGDALSFAGGQVGQGVASMMDPMAVSAGLATAGRAASLLPGVGKLAGLGLQGAALGVPYMMSKNQLTGEFIGEAEQDQALMDRTSPQALRDMAGSYGGLAAIPDSALPGLVGRQFSGLTRAGSSAARQGAMGAGAKAALGMGLEGGTETLQNMGSQFARGELNPDRDTSGDLMDNVNSFAGGAIGGGPFAVAGAMAEAGHNRLDAGVDAVKGAAGDVVDMYNESETAQSVVKQGKKWFGRGKEATIDLMSDEDGKVSASALMENLKAGAQDLKSQADTKFEEHKVLNEIPPDDILADDAKLAEWLNANAPARHQLVVDKLADMPEDDVEAQQHLLAVTKEYSDPAEQDAAVAAAAQFVNASQPLGRVQERAASLGESMGKLAGVAGNLAGKGVVAAAKGAVSFGKSVLGGAQEGMRKKNEQAEAAPEDFGAWRDRTYGVQGQAQAAQALADADPVATQRADLAGNYVGDMVRRLNKTDPNLGLLARHAAFSLADVVMKTGAKGLGDKSVKLNRLVDDLYGAFRSETPEVLSQLSSIMGPKAAPVFEYMAKEVAARSDKSGFRNQVAARNALASQTVALVDPGAQNKLMAQGINLNTPRGREQLLGIMEDFADGIGSSSGMRKALEGTFGAESVQNILTLLNGQPEKESPYGVTNQFDAQDIKDAEKTTAKGSGPKVYGFYKAGNMRSDSRSRDPFAATAEAGGDGVARRPGLFTKGQQLFGGKGDAITKKITDLKAQLTEDPEYPDHDNYDVRAKSAYDVMKEANLQPGKVLQLYRDYLTMDSNIEEAAAVSSLLTQLVRAQKGSAVSGPEERAERSARAKVWAAANPGKSVEDYKAAQASARTAALAGPQAEMVRAAETYFKERFVVVGEQLSNRDPGKMAITELLDLHREGAGMIERSRGEKVGGVFVAYPVDVAREKLSDANILMFKSDAVKGGEVAIPAGKLVNWVRKQRGMSEASSAEDTDGSFSNGSKDEQYLADVMEGITTLVGSKLVKGLPYKVNQFGKSESFTKDGAPDSLRLATKTAGAMKFATMSRREKRKARSDAELATVGAPGYDDEVAADQARNSEFFTPDDSAARDVVVGDPAGPHTPKRVGSASAPVKGDEVSMSLDRVRDIDKVGRESGEKFADSAADTKTSDGDRTPLDFGQTPKDGAPDEYANQRWLSRQTGASTDDSIGPEPKGTAVSSAKFRADAIMATYNNDPDAGFAAMEMRMRSAVRPSYSDDKSALVGGAHYAAPVAYLVNADRLAAMDLSPAELARFAALRKQVAEVLLTGDTSVPEKVKIARLMSTDPSKVTALNVNAMMNRVAGGAAQGSAVVAKQETPVQEAPKADMLTRAIAKRQEYLNNPPDDYSTEQAQAIADWTKAQLTRVLAQKSDDADRQDQLSDYKYALLTLQKKAASVLEVDAYLKDIEGTAAPEVANAGLPKGVQTQSGGRNQQQGNARVATQAEMDAAKAYALKTLGPKIKVEFKDITGYSGEFIDAKNVIEISTTAAAGTLGTLYHEAMHVFFRDFVKGNPRMVATFESLINDPKHLTKLHALLDGYPAAQAQLHGAGSGEERLAYTYQFWKAGLLQVDTKASTWLQKLGKFFRKVLGTVRDSERALELFQAFDNGKMSEPSAAGMVIAKALGAGSTSMKVRRNLDSAIQGLAALTVPAGEILGNSVSPTARKLGTIFFTNPGEEAHGDAETGLLNARRAVSQQYINTVNRKFETMSETDQARAQSYLQAQTELADIPDAELRAAVKDVRAVLDRFHKYMTDAGMNIGKIDKYYPTVWSAGALNDKKAEFISMLVNKYAQQMNPNGGNAQKSAERIWRSLVDKEGVDAHLPAGREDGVLSPFFASQEMRTLPWLDGADKEKFLEKNMPLTLTRYFNQGAHATEYFRRFGENGKRLEIMLHRIRTELSGASKEMMARGQIKDDAGRTKWVSRQMRDITQSVGAMEGSLGKDVSPSMRKFNSWMAVYQNVRVLPLALFSSFVDPLAMVARGAPLQAAYETFMYGMREVFRGWADAFRDMPPERVKDEWRQLAEHIGASEIAMFQHHVADEYASAYMTSGAKKINDKMFVLNGMEAWNRGSRIMATKWAVRFLEKHADLPDKNHSARWLQELGLKADMITLDDGKLVTDRHVLAALKGISVEEAGKQIAPIHAALNRWVEGSVLTPNAAQRPAWSSDPNFATLFHLKQFSYSFHQTILKRAVNEFKHGNMAPVGALAMFIPTMITSDILKGLIQGGGGLPPYMASMNAGDWFVHGVQRAGLAGIGSVGMDAGSDWASLGGPAFEQIADAARDGFGSKTALKAMPLNSLYGRMVTD